MVKQCGRIILVLLMAGAAAFVGVVLAQSPAASSASATQATTPQVVQGTASSAVPSLNLRIAGIPPVELKSPAGGLVRDLGPTIISFLSVLTALIALFLGQRSNDKTIAAAQRSTETTLWQKANETELRDIEDQLGEFYLPFIQMSEANSLLAQELKSRQPDRDTYRLLIKVFDQRWLDRLSQGDRTIVREVCENAGKLEAFIRDHTKMVDGEVLPYLSRASAHFRILYLAHRRELGTDSTHFESYVYPRQLDKVLKIAVDRLKGRCDLLRSNPYTAPEPMRPLIIPEEFKLPAWPPPFQVAPKTGTPDTGPRSGENQVASASELKKVEPGMNGVLAKLRAKNLLDDDIAAEIAALWKFGVDAVTDPGMREALILFLENEAPSSFFVSQASLSGKHHPSWQRKKGGIVRNTVECCVVLDRQLQSYPEFTESSNGSVRVRPRDRDIVLVATILSDTFKYGNDDDPPKPGDVGRYDSEHGKKAAEKFRPIAASRGVSTEVIDYVYEATYWHLGRWTLGWKPDTTWSHYVDVTHRVDMFMSDNNLELVYDSKTRVAV